MKTLAVIGANEPLIPFYEQLVGKFRIIAFAWEQGAVCKKYCEKFYPISFTEKERILEICKKEHVDGVTSFSLESALPTVVYLAKHLNLVGNSEECVRLTATKFSQRECFKKNNLPIPHYWLVGDDENIESVKCNFPVIVKPIDSGGSLGLNVATSKEELKNAISKSLPFSKSSKVLVEDYIDGREFSVEYISYKGKHYFLQITDKVTTGQPHFVEVQHHQPAAISEDLASKIKNIVEKALTSLKISNSASHSEIKLDSAGNLYLIEIGARLGGGHIGSDLVKLSTGYDFVEGVANLACGDFVEPVKNLNKYSGIYYYNKLQPKVRDYILNAHNFADIVKTSWNNDDLKDVTSNLDRENGFLIYQSSSKFYL